MLTWHRYPNGKTRNNIYFINMKGKVCRGYLRFTLFSLQNFSSASHLFCCILRKIPMNDRNAHPSLFKNTPILKYTADATTSCYRNGKGGEGTRVSKLKASLA
jgi:hypothetical protein